MQVFILKWFIVLTVHKLPVFDILSMQLSGKIFFFLFFIFYFCLIERYLINKKLQNFYFYPVKLNFEEK